MSEHTDREWIELCQRFDFRCVRCGVAESLTKDHIIPRSQDGADTIDNLQPLCKPCNSQKSDKTIDYRDNPFQNETIPRFVRVNISFPDSTQGQLQDLSPFYGGNASAAIRAAVASLYRYHFEPGSTVTDASLEQLRQLLQGALGYIDGEFMRRGE